MHRTMSHTIKREGNTLFMVTISIAAWRASPYSSNRLLSQNSYQRLSSSIFVAIIPQISQQLQTLNVLTTSVDKLYIRLNFPHTSYNRNWKIKKLKFAIWIGDCAVRHSLFRKLFGLRHFRWHQSPREPEKNERKAAPGNFKIVFCSNIFISKVRLKTELESFIGTEYLLESARKISLFPLRVLFETLWLCGALNSRWPQHRKKRVICV